jgi:hypothetical protein
VPLTDLHAAEESVRGCLPIDAQATAVTLMTQQSIEGQWTKAATFPWHASDRHITKCRWSINWPDGQLRPIPDTASQRLIAIKSALNSAP